MYDKMLLLHKSKIIKILLLWELIYLIVIPYENMSLIFARVSRTQ